LAATRLKTGLLRRNVKKRKPRIHKGHEQGKEGRGGCNNTFYGTRGKGKKVNDTIDGFMMREREKKQKMVKTQRKKKACAIWGVKMLRKKNKRRPGGRSGSKSGGETTQSGLTLPEGICRQGSPKSVRAKRATPILTE